MATDGLQTWVLKVYIHREGCKRKVKKVLQSIEGVCTTTVEAAEQRVTVTGRVESGTLIKALVKAGKQAELWSQGIDKQQKKVKFEAAEPPKEGCDQGGKKGKAAKDSHKKSKGGEEPSTSTGGGGGGEGKSSATKEEGGGGKGKSSGEESNGGASSGDETTTAGGGAAAEVVSGGGVVAGMTRYVPETVLVVNRNAATMSGGTAMVHGAYPMHYNNYNPLVASYYAEEGEAESRNGIDDPTYLFNDENANNCCIV